MSAIELMLAEGRINPMEFPDVVTSSPGYASRFSGATGAWLLQVQNDLLSGIVSQYSGASVLDVAGGHGQVAGALAQLDNHVTVLGSSPECGIRIEGLARSGRCTFAVGNIEKLPYADRSFELITCFRYLAHTPNWRNVIGELARVARRAIIVDYPILNSLNFFSPLFFKFKNRVEGNTRPFAVLRKSAVDSAFAAHGFEEVSSFKQFFLPMAFHRLVQARDLSASLEGICRSMGITALLGSPVIGHYKRSDAV